MYFVAIRPRLLCGIRITRFPPTWCIIMLAFQNATTSVAAIFEKISARCLAPKLPPCAQGTRNPWSEGLLSNPLPPGPQSAEKQGDAKTLGLEGYLVTPSPGPPVPRNKGTPKPLGLEGYLVTPSAGPPVPEKQGDAKTLGLKGYLVTPPPGPRVLRTRGIKKPLGFGSLRSLGETV
jgi:hypothetical protein